MKSTQDNQNSRGADRTLSDLVRGDHRLSSVFDRYGLNYCCRGERTLAQACAETDLDEAQVLSDMARLANERVPAPTTPEATIRDALNLLYEEYEPRLKEMLLPALARLQKVAGSHGEEFPQTVAAAEAMDQLIDELEAHLSRGKDVLYPKVEQILGFRDQGNEQLAQATFSSLAHLMSQFKAENRTIQRYLSEVREFTSHYQVPDGVCTSFAVSYQELAEFDEVLSRFLDVETRSLIAQLVGDPKGWR